MFTRHFSKKQSSGVKEGTKSQQARERGKQTKPSGRVERGNSALCHRMRREGGPLQGKHARYRGWKTTHRAKLCSRAHFQGQNPLQHHGSKGTEASTARIHIPPSTHLVQEVCSISKWERKTLFSCTTAAVAGSVVTDGAPRRSWSICWALPAPRTHLTSQWRLQAALP